MTSDEIFKVMLENPILLEKYGLTTEELEKMSLSKPSKHDIIEVIKMIVIGIENQQPESSINSQIKTHFNI